MTQAYIIIDMQNDFIDGSLGTPEAQAIVPHCRRQKLLPAKKDTDQETDLIFTQDTHDSDYLETREGRNSPSPTASKIRGAGASANSFCLTR